MKQMLTIALLCLCPVWTVQGQEAEGWSITAHSQENYNGVMVANGRIGIVSGPGLFDVSEIILNGVYDKEDDRGEGVSRIVRGPNFAQLTLKIDGETVSEPSITDWEQTLNMKKAYLETSFSAGGKASVKYSLRALRQLPYMGLLQVEIIPRKDIVLEVSNTTAFPAELKETSTAYKVLQDGSIRMPVYVSQAQSRTKMHDLATCTGFLFEGVPQEIYAPEEAGHPQGMNFQLKLAKDVPFRFVLVGAICSSKDFASPRAEAERMTVFALRSTIQELLEGHEREWERLWQSDIVIEGDIEAQKDVRLALYSLYSSVGENTRLGIPPMGLSSTTGYNGHVFWDMEIWMYPPLLALNPAMARSCVDYRYDRLAKACQKAYSYGYEGCMFPWESDDTGEEATPTWCLTGTFEHHITADVGIAFWNYYCVTKDIDWLRDEGYPVLKNVADFWVSRAVRNADGSYSINNVVGANEFAPNVDDNAFTNGSAKYVLACAVKAAKELGEKANPSWTTVSDNLRFHYDDNGVLKENSNYQGEIIKQADVNLLSYPLDIISDKETIEANLVYYAPKIHENGPAMGNAILSVLYARLGDKKKAYEYFQKSYLPNKRPPFGALSESAYSNNPYFCTGAGGLLQAMLFGFGGLHLTENGIVQKEPLLPDAWKSLTLKGVGKDKKNYVILPAGKRSR